MNKVVKAENEKIAAIDFATATETQADGQRRAEIKKAEGIRQAKILAAEGEAQAIKLVNEAAEQYFVGNAQVLRKLETVEKAFWQNAKIIVPANGQLVNVIGDLAGVTPVPVKAAQPNPTPGQPHEAQLTGPAGRAARRAAPQAFFLRGFFSLGGRLAA